MDEQHPEHIEWPTVAVAVACWSMFVAVLVLHDRLPTAMVIVGLALLGGWYMSLQHEVLHGHPTPWPWVNVALVCAPLSLWLPYSVYRDSHLRHHEVELTVPGVDPESFYVEQATWDAAPGWRRLLLRANCTLAGRLTVGPVLSAAALATSELALARKDRGVARPWLVHVASAAIVAWVVFGVADVPPWQYLVGYSYLGLSVTLVRSFAEHRDVPDSGARSAVVGSGWFFGILFLFNNLHHTHHALPGAAWYRLPQLTEEMGAGDIAAAGAGRYRGYGEVVRRYAFRPFTTPVTSLAPIIERQ
ncbi:MAG: fatty acid desaturase [Actinomycetota bacterium]